MTKNQKIFAGIDALVESEGIPKDIVVSGLEEAVGIACRKHYGIDNVEVIFDTETKRIKITGYKIIVEKDILGEAFEETQFIDIADAKEIKASAKVGQKLKYRLKLTPEIMERSTISTAKQVFRQKLREAKYQKILSDYGEKIGRVVIGSLAEEKNGFIYFKLAGNIEAVLPPGQQNPNDHFTVEQYKDTVPVPVYINNIQPQSTKGPKVSLSRSHSSLVAYEMEKAIPEIEEGIISIKAVSRDAGSRSKVAVSLVNEDDDIDVIGTVVGTSGTRINGVKKAIGGESIDLIEYFDDPIMYISNALAPALVTAVQLLDEEQKTARVVVPNDQLSLAIGAKGQNVRLASQLTGWKIDILSENEATEKGINYEDDII